MSLQSGHPARYWEKISGSSKVLCTLCPRECRIADGKKGFCYIRENAGGELVSTGYGRLIGLALDPIEKKPLYHFYPGEEIVSFGTAGCNLGCTFCQNWDMSRAKSIDHVSKYIPPERIPEIAAEFNSSMVAFTYNDPVIFAEYAIDAARECHSRGIKTVVVTAGYISGKARKDLFSIMDGANVDLKAFNDSFYKKYCSADIETVKETLVHIREQEKTWLEITTLLIPGLNDSSEELKAECEWIISALGADTPVHFSAFHPDYKMTDKKRTPWQSLQQARILARKIGLRHVYVGNVIDEMGESTWCPACGELLVNRRIYEIRSNRVQKGCCFSCGEKIPGHFH